MKKVNVPKVIFPDVWNGEQYPKMEGDSRLAKRFNELQQESWVHTGAFYDPQDLLLQILAEEYNEKSG